MQSIIRFLREKYISWKTKEKPLCSDFYCRPAELHNGRWKPKLSISPEERISQRLTRQISQ